MNIAQVKAFSIVVREAARKMNVLNCCKLRVLENAGTETKVPSHGQCRTDASMNQSTPLYSGCRNPFSVQI